MAEIKIEKKKPIWPWILLAAIILAVILYFVFADNNDDDGIDDDVTTEQVIQDDTNENSEAVMAYETAFDQYSNYIGETKQMGINHEYSHKALDLLIEATEAKANVLDIDLKADLDQARKNSEAITVEPYEVNHADLIKDSGEIITRALSTLQKDKFPNLSNELAMVEENVSSISKEELTLDQKGDVNSFFKSAESLLNKMN